MRSLLASGTSRSASPWIMSTGGSSALAKPMGETAPASSGSKSRAGNLSFGPTDRVRSTGGNRATTAWTRLETRSTGSAATGSPASPASPSINDRCPPALPPLTPIRSGSMPWSAACMRMWRTARRTSSTASGTLKSGALPWWTANTVNPASSRCSNRATRCVGGCQRENQPPLTMNATAAPLGSRGWNTS